MFQKLDLFLSLREETETRTLLCPLERANLNHSIVQGDEVGGSVLIHESNHPQN
jgi:hypothetical protein